MFIKVSHKDMLLKSEIVGISKVTKEHEVESYKIDFIMRGNAKKLIGYSNYDEREHWYKTIAEEMNKRSYSNAGFNGR